MDTSKNLPRTRGKPFQAGNNLGKGRPQGSRNKATIALQQLLDGEGEAITRRVIDMALTGNEVAVRVCMERLIAPRKDRPIRLRLPSITTATGVDAALNAILQAVAKGEITPGEAGNLTGLLEARRRSIETVELADKIAMLEQQNHEH